MQKVRRHHIFPKRTLVSLIISLSLLLIIILQRPVYASPKSLYVIADLKAPMRANPIQIYEMRPAPTYLVYQKTQNAPIHGSGALDLTIDSESQTLFITYEYTNIIQLINATTFANLGITAAPNASNLAGIVYDHDKSLIYTVNRETNNLYVFQWDSVTCELTFKSHVDLNHSSRVYSIALDETNDILYVADGECNKFDWYSTDTWALLGTKTTTHAVIGIAVDANNGFVYTSGGNDITHTGEGWFDYGLYKYDMKTDTETAVLNGTGGKYAGVLDVAVDPSQNTSLIYVTTYGIGSAGYTDVLLVFDSNLTELWRSGDLGNPTGIAIPRGEISYNPQSPDVIEYLPGIILGLVGCIALFGGFCIFKRGKRCAHRSVQL